MQWHDIRQIYPDQWLVIEILDSHTEGSRVVPDRIAVIETCPDGTAAFERYRLLHREYPLRFRCFIHTHRADLQLEERQWAGILGMDLLTELGAIIDLDEFSLRFARAIT